MQALILTLLVVQAFGAAAIGYFSNLPLTYVGGLLIGIAGALATKYVVDVPWLIGLPPGLPFIVLFVVLLVTPRSEAGPAAVPHPADDPLELARARSDADSGGGAVALGRPVPDPVVGGHRPRRVLGRARDCDPVPVARPADPRCRARSRCASTPSPPSVRPSMAHFTTDHGFPWLVALLLAGLVAVPVGAIIAIPAIRLSGVFLALATLGFGILLEQMFYTQDFMFGPTSEGITVARPYVRPRSLPCGYRHRVSTIVILVVVVLVAVGVAVLSATRLGKLLAARWATRRSRSRPLGLNVERDSGHRVLHLGLHRRHRRRAHRQPLHVRRSGATSLRSAR